MIDLQDLRKRPEAYIQACTKKRIALDIRALLTLDEEFRSQKKRVEDLRSQQNTFSKEISRYSGDEKKTKLAEMKVLSDELKLLADSQRELETRLNKELLLVPSIPLAEVPEGKDDSENVEAWKWGTPKPQFEGAKDHVALGKSLGILDIDRGVKLAGARNYFLVGDGARLQHALFSLSMDVLRERGYLMMDPPHLVNYQAMMGTSYFPGGEESAYALDARDEGHYLIGTSEVSVTSFHADEILREDELPKRYAGYSPCYRREAGTYGKDVHGLYRVHQFYKVEQVVLCREDAAESATFHQELLKNAEHMLQLLGLPYRVVVVCSGDMGRGQVFKHDIETWMPSRKSYGETHSCSTFHDFQSRRLNMRYRDAQGKVRFVHTLNNTCIASPRVLIPILETYQNPDGSVSIPEALRPYMGGQTVIVPRA